MTLKTGANRSFNPYKTGFLSCPSLILQPLTMGNNLVNPGHLILQLYSKVIPHPSKGLKSSMDSATVTGIKMRQNPMPLATIRAIGFRSILHPLLLKALVYIGVFLNFMHLKNAITSRARARYLANDHFFKSRQAFPPGGLSPHRAYTEQQVLISFHGLHPFYPSMVRLVLKNLVSWLLYLVWVLLIIRKNIVSSL